MDQISVGTDGAVWGVKCTAFSGSGVNQTCSSEGVYFFNSGTQTFQQVSGAPNLAQVSVGYGANVWGVDVNGAIYQYNQYGGTWSTIPGELNLIQVAANGSVWGINAAGSTYYYNFNSSSWVQVPGSLGILSVGVDGQVWGINANLQIYQYNAGSWVNIPGSLTEISVGNANNIWGINEQDQVYQWNVAYGNWTYIGGVSLDEVWTTFDGAVWGVDTSGNPYEWNSSTQTFSSVPGNVTLIVAGNAAKIGRASCRERV